MMDSQQGIRRIALILCLLPAAYFLVMAIYALLNFDKYAYDLPRLLRYVVGPMGIAVFLVACAIFLRKSNGLMIGITATSILTAMFLFELYMTISLLPREMDLAGVVAEDVQIDRYQQALPPSDTIKRLNAVQEIETLDQALLSGIPDQEVMLCSVLGQPVTYTADRYGFRNADEAVEPPVDILVLGDSFAEGYCLGDGLHFVDRIRDEVPSLFNTGSRGAGPLFELAVLGRYGPYFKPKVTLMAFFEGNDWRNLRREYQINWLREALAPDVEFGAVEWTEEQRNSANAIIAERWQETDVSYSSLLRRRQVLRNFFGLHKTAAALGLHYPAATPGNPVYEEVLLKAKQVTESWGGELVIVYLPYVDRFGGLFNHGFAHSSIHEMVTDAARKADVDLIDITPAFMAHEDPRSLYAPDSHFSEKGAVLTAETVLQHESLEGLHRR